MKRNPFAEVEISPEHSAAGGYKTLLGGGLQNWLGRGAFQLELMKELGLLPQHRLADYGCGPIRGGQHLIRYLDAGRYHGYDFRREFIDIAEGIVREDSALSEKRPDLFWQTDFLGLRSDYDFILLFSVLNHCGAAERDRTLALARAVGPKTRIVVTHASWCDDVVESSGVRHRRIMPEQLPERLAIRNWGWAETGKKAVLFPIYVLGGAG